MSRHAIETEKSLATTATLYQKNLCWSMSYNITSCTGGFCHLLFSVLILLFSRKYLRQTGKKFPKVLRCTFTTRRIKAPEMCCSQNISHSIKFWTQPSSHIFWVAWPSTWFKSRLIQFWYVLVLDTQAMELAICMKFKKHYYFSYLLISVSMSLFPLLSYFSFMVNRP